MIKPLLTLSATFLFATTGLSQGLGIELFTGLTNYQGDLRQRFFTLQGSRPAFGLGVTYDLNSHFTARVAAKTGTLGADDKLNKDSAIYFRNLSFQTRLSDVEAVLMYRLFSDDRSRINLYGFGGVAVFRFNPYTYDQFGIQRYLQPLGTEGQGLSGYPQSNLYSLTELSIPVGFALQYRLTPNVSLAWEFAFRKTFTDYIDDLSTDYADEFDLLFGRGPVAADLSYRGDEMLLTNPNVPYSMPKGARRGNPGAKDLYYFTGLNLRYNFQGKDRFSSGGRFGGSNSRRSAECPRW
jgi:hypothetical protein